VRIRSTKPEFWKSRRITSVSWDARLVLKGLESYVDDNGVGVDDIELIVTDVFPRDMFANGSETVARVSEAISELHQAGLVHRYTSENDHLLFISFWEEVQRIDKPGKGRNPRPDGTMNYRDSAIRDTLASPPETLAPGTGEQGNRGTGEQGSRGAGADAPLSPFCSKHPNGTEDNCRPCGTARTAFARAQAAEKAKPAPMPFTVAPGSICAGGKHVLVADGTCTRCTYRPEVVV
jgi:hypothetical protein